MFTRLVAAALMLTLPAAAQDAPAMVTAANPEGVMRAMQEEGYLATMGVDNIGDPKISSKVSQSNFSVYFYGCNNAVDCTSIQFSSGYNLEIPISAKRMNDWNRENRFTRGYVDDEGDPFIRLDIVMAGEGISAESFAYDLDFWRILVEDFEDFIDW